VSGLENSSSFARDYFADFTYNQLRSGNKMTEEKTEFVSSCVSRFLDLRSNLAFNEAYLLIINVASFIFISIFPLLIFA